MALRRVPETNEWEDVSLVRGMLDILDTIKFFNDPGHFTIDQNTAKKPRLKGGLARLALRFCLTMIQEGDVRVCVENIPRIRAILRKDFVPSKKVWLTCYTVEGNALTNEKIGRRTVAKTLVLCL